MSIFLIHLCKRLAVNHVLLMAGFIFDPGNPEHRMSNRESRYSLYRLPYEPGEAGQGGLATGYPYRNRRLRRAAAAVERSVISFFGEAFKRLPEIPAIACAAIVETASAAGLG